ncbi:MAG: ATP-binding protein [Deltaproteobacteria bacterium]|nr:ATP-binding protein [Deltaproteobacteria bacterium]
MDITTFNLSNPWRIGRNWDVPHIERNVTRALLKWLDEPEILILSGARQVGKTSVLLQLIDWLIRMGKTGPEAIYFFNLDLAGISEFLEDQGRFLRFLDAERERKIFVFIDEVQRLPQPGIFLKALQDLRLPIKFILTGSSSLDIRTRTHEPLTGRKQVFHVETLSFREYVKTLPSLSSLPPLDRGNYSAYISALNEALSDYAVYGGYPAPALTSGLEKRVLRLNEIFSSYLEKDIAGFLKVENVPAFRKLVMFLSAQQGSLVNVQELASTLSVHRETVGKYIHYLEETFVIKRMTPLFSNPRTEHTKMPKIYFSDAGLRNLAMGNFSDFDTRSDKGEILEGVVAGHMFRNRLLSNRVNFWRTKSGAEMDFVLSGVKPVQAVEVKSGVLKSVTVSRGYRSFLSKYNPEKALILNSSLWSEAEIEGHRVEAVPTAVFLLGLDRAS